MAKEVEQRLRNPPGAACAEDRLEHDSPWNSDDMGTLDAIACPYEWQPVATNAGIASNVRDDQGDISLFFGWFPKKTLAHDQVKR